VHYWRGGFVADMILVLSLLFVAVALRRSIAPMRRVGIPDALVAGVIGLTLGPAALGVLDFDSANLEPVVYHGMALVFIAVSLQSPPQGQRSGVVRSLAFSIPSMVVFQAVIGMGIILAWNALRPEPLHPGIGLMLPLGFSQGPGAALTFGSAWEADRGMTDGAQIGLIFSAVGFAWCIGGGVLAISIARRRGWVAPATETAPLPATDDRSPENPRPGSSVLEPLTAQIAMISLVYLATYGFLSAVAPHAGKHETTLWAFHFIIGTLLAILARSIIGRMPPAWNPLDDMLLVRTSNAIVDVSTTCALAAIKIGVLATWFVPIATVTSVGGMITLIVVLWLARRAFASLPFHHGTILYGAMTGTATTGLALLRMIDPGQRTPVARNYVIASAGASMMALPLLAIIGRPLEGWPGSYPTPVLETLGIVVVYLVILVLIWRRTTTFRLVRPWRRIWPDVPGHD
jgi:ESS family glutamate:Na+ symporter